MMSDPRLHPSQSEVSAQSTYLYFDEDSPNPSESSSGLAALIAELGIADTEGAKKDSSPNQLELFLKATTAKEKLEYWFGETFVRKTGDDHARIQLQLDRSIEAIDRLLQSQISAVLSHKEFQRIESVWRGAWHLTECKAEQLHSPIQVRILNATWREIRDDQEDAIEFDQSCLFKKIYEEGLGQAGAIPFSTLLLDFEVHPRPSKSHPFDDLTIIKRLAETASAAFAPVYVNASPTMFGVDSFEELRQTVDLESIHSQPSFRRWQQFRNSEESRFISILLPKILMRRTYNQFNTLGQGFPYIEKPLNRNDMVWGGAVWAMGEVLIRNFGSNRWFTNIRGIQRGKLTGGIVQGPAVDRFFTEQESVSKKSITNINVSDIFETQLARSGFTTLCSTKYGSEACFHSSPSVHKPKRYDKVEATANAELASLTNYILCACRFGHYVKIISRDQIGSYLDANDIQNRLNSWILDYVNRDPDATEERRAEKPLLEAMIQVRPRPGKPGEFECVIQLEPFHTFDDVSAMIRLDTRLVVNEKR